MLQPLSTDRYLPTLPGIARYFDASVATVQWTPSIFIAGFGLWQLVAPGRWRTAVGDGR